MSTLRRTGPGHELARDLQVLGMEPVMRPVTALMAFSLAFALATFLFVIDTQVYRFAPVPVVFLILAGVLQGLRRLRPPPPLPDPDRVRIARAATAAFGADRVTVDFDADRDPWLKLEVAGTTVELGGAGDAPTITPPNHDVRTRLEAVLDDAPADS